VLSCVLICCVYGDSIHAVVVVLCLLVAYLHAVCNTINVYRVSQEECARLRESVPYVKVYRYNSKHLYAKLNGYGDNGQRILKL